MSILFQNDHSGIMSSKRKTPWLEYNGNTIADSQLGMDFLSDRLDLQLDINLSQEHRAVARAFRELAEENLYWTMCYESFVRNPKSLDVLLKDVFSPLKKFMFKNIIGFFVKRQLWSQGMGRHSDSEIWQIGREDLTALSQYLGEKPYLMGAEPCQADCSVFGMLAMVVWQMRGSRHEQFVYAELPNLVQYCERVRDRFWPDWDNRCKRLDFVDDNHKIYCQR
ncbi:failed axon connections [Plakobranchus ocellatus]|uniref:Failed axon connections n=1 Tax=Plakobranchus ocellatus TaxID=259542 RepID=A0AAV4AWR3_9GAST|nr:failed axon connections [Plakobranchus ocellatus]